MRLPANGNTYFAKNVNFAYENLRSTYIEAIKPQLVMKKVNVMLGDGTITESHTFEPEKVKLFFQRMIDSLDGWDTTGILSSNTDDLHRLYCEFTQEAGEYYLHGYFGIQYQALPYYRTDRRVIEIQRELAHTVDKANGVFKLISNRGNDILHKELESTGHAEMGFEEFLNKLFEDTVLLEHLQGKAAQVEDEFPEFKEMNNKKIQLFAELDKLVTKLYQISPVSIDYSKLTQGEEGIITYFDVGSIKGKRVKERNLSIDTKKINKQSTEHIVHKLMEVTRALYNISTQ